MLINGINPLWRSKRRIKEFRLYLIIKKMYSLKWFYIHLHQSATGWVLLLSVTLIQVVKCYLLVYFKDNCTVIISSITRRDGGRSRYGLWCLCFAKSLCVNLDVEKKMHVKIHKEVSKPNRFWWELKLVIALSGSIYVIGCEVYFHWECHGRKDFVKRRNRPKSKTDFWFVILKVLLEGKNMFLVVFHFEGNMGSRIE